MVDIRLPLNEFAQSQIAGTIAEINAGGPALETVQLISTSIATVVPGMPVKLVPGGYASGVRQVELADPLADDMLGLVVFDPKVQAYTAGGIFQITTEHVCMNLVSSGSLPRGSYVGLDKTASYKLVAASGNNVIGQLDYDASTNAVVKVDLHLPLKYRSIVNS